MRYWAALAVIVLQLTGGSLSANFEEVVGEHKELPLISATDDPSDALAIITKEFDCYFLNPQQVPLVISPKSANCSVAYLKRWAKAHQAVFKALLDKYTVILLRNFPLETADDFVTVMKDVLGREPADYAGGEGSRSRVTNGVYTSTAAPAHFLIPLHHELSCTDRPSDYICFYCDIAPEPGTGQTTIGRTEDITQGMLQRPEVWQLFDGRIIKYISRHPPEGSFYSRINISHKTWPDAFATHDRAVVERICQEKGFEYAWYGDWIEVTRRAPAMGGPDRFFDHPYWFNQAHNYHANARIRGGWLNHIIASILYMLPHTAQYDVEFDDGTPIPTYIVYQIYDVLEENTIKFDWHKGDAAIWDNHRAMHGRAPTSSERRILVSMF